MSTSSADAALTSLMGAALSPSALLDAWPDCVRILSADGEILYVTPRGLQMLEVDDLARVRGRQWWLMWPENLQEIVKAAVRAAAAGSPANFRGYCLTAKGSPRWWDNVVIPIRGDAGKVTHLMATSRDVTTSVEAEAFFNTLVHLLPNPLLVKNARDGRYVLINQAAEEAFGLSAEEALGKTAFELFPEAEAAAFASEDRAVLESGRLQVSEEEPVTTRRGVRYFTTKKLATYDGGEPLHLITIGEDVTERREAALALRAALAEAEAANRAKSAFLANMSHEIRTPLNGIVAGADMLQRAPLDPRSNEIVEIIASSSATLERLLGDILDLARIEAGELTLERTTFDLGELARSTAALAKLRADEKGVALIVSVAPEADGPVEGDPTRLRQVLMNLLSNAVKFTEQGSVRLTVQRDGETVRMEVRDSGIGFDPAVKERLFSRFQQADGSITRRFGGTGLGMTISRELVSLMGGRIDADGRPGAGATFWFELPLPPASGVCEASAAPPDPERPLRVLLADDHPTNRKVVELLLSGFAEVTSVENGQEALRAVEAGAFDIVLMDMQMPVMDGLTAVRELRRREAAEGRPRTPIVMLTANALPEHVQASLEAGADRHLEKPVTLASLLQAMSDVSEEGDEAEAASAPSVGG